MRKPFKHHTQEIFQAISHREPFEPAFVLLPHALMAERFQRHLATDPQRALAAMGVRVATWSALVADLSLITQVPHQGLLHRELLIFLIRQVFAQSLVEKWNYFKPSLLKEGSGYAESFADVILELDEAGWDAAETLTQGKRSGIDRLIDVGLVWKGLEKISGGSRLRGAFLLQMAKILETYPERLAQAQRLLGPVIWLQTQKETVSERRLLKVLEGIPGSQAVPISELEEMEGLSRLQHPILEGLEGYESVEAEFQATERWLHQQLLVSPSPEYPNPDIALIAPAAEIPHLESLIVRSFSPDLVSVSHSRNVGSERALVLAVIGALRSHLSAERMLEIFPHLSAGSRSRESWIDKINARGVLGGSSGDAHGSRQWSDRLLKGDQELEVFSEAIRSLISLHEELLKNASFEELGISFLSWCKAHLRLPVPARGLLAALEQGIQAGSHHQWLSQLKGEEALNRIQSIVTSFTVRSGSPTQARVLIGTLEELSCLPFRAIRWVRMSEGAYPSVVYENAVLPDHLREQLPGQPLQTTRHKTLAQRRELRVLLSGKPLSFSLSSARQQTDGSESAPSTLYFDLLYQGLLDQNGALKKDSKLNAMLHQLFSDSQRRLREGSVATPRSSLDWVRWLRESRAQPQALTIPEDWGSQWSPSQAFDVAQVIEQRVQETQADQFSSWDGYGAVLGTQLTEKLPGSEVRPLRPSQIGKILDCPMQFLLSIGLGWSEPREIQEPGSLNPMARGTLCHKILQWVYEEHTPLDLRTMTEQELSRICEPLIERAFAQDQHTQFLTSLAAQAHEKKKILRLAVTVLLQDQAEGLAVARPEVAVKAQIQTRSGVLHLEGTTDRVDTLHHPDGTTSRRLVDYKTGRGKPETQEQLLPSYDIQLVAYYLSLVEMGEIEPRELTSLEFRYMENPRNPKRTFKADALQRLLNEGSDWIHLIHSLISGGILTRTTREKTCERCSFQAVCGIKRAKITQEKLKNLPFKNIQALLELWDRMKNEYP